MELDSFVKPLWDQLHITAKTKKNYIGAYERNLKPILGGHDLSSICKAEIIEATSLLPAQTRYQTLMVARVIFREALERNLIVESPAQSIKAPKLDIHPQKFLKWEELKGIDFGFHTARIQFLALHGLRYGEAAALRESDIHDGRVFITKSKYGPTKTVAGHRSVPQLAPFISFPKYQDGIARELKPYGVTVHSLRKTYAYLLKNSQVHVTTAAKLLGHSNPLVTLKIYTQVLDNEIDSAGASVLDYLKVH